MVRDAQPDAGVLGVKAPQPLRQVDVQRGLGGADADRAVGKAGTGAQLLLGILDLHGGGGDAGVKVLALRRQRDAPIGADEQHAMQLVFQLVHHVGDVGLVAAQHAGSLGKVLVLGHVVKDFVVVPIHVHDGVPSPVVSYCQPRALGSNISAAW